MTADSLRTRTCKDLAQIAKQHKVDGWHSMRKEQLVMAILRAVQKKSAKNSTAKKAAQIAAAGKRTGQAVNGRGKSPRGGANGRATSPHQSLKDLTTTSGATDGGKGKDRLVVMVRDAYWLHACWELRRQGVERAAAALRHDWHTAQPVIRLLAVSADDTTSAAETVIRDIPIHGGVNNWYIHVEDPPATYRLDIGYLAASGKFYSLARSNRVTTPPPGSYDPLDENWRDVAENFDKVYALSGGYARETAGELQELFEERLRRPMGASAMTRFGISPEKIAESQGDFHFEVDAEMIVFGVATPGSHVTLRGQPVELREDGSFTLRVSMPEGRQVVPVVANTSHGTEQRTIVLALERNTKTLETVVREPEEPTAD
ncbi:MAG: DUF4912 domain-containing protein [Planctomycetota bacterium]|nr:MAG: DUF4912 domain-containing protein [Planctomycetota bacterium]REK43336.1 MAG: DUF4912 domain-containing protein [Planctomycetota bacterium]